MMSGESRPTSNRRSRERVDEMSLTDTEQKLLRDLRKKTLPARFPFFMLVASVACAAACVVRGKDILNTVNMGVIDQKRD